MLAFALIPASLLALVSARLHHSRVPDDPYAFPKYRVTFLNGLPILNDTVQRWMQEGLRGGQAEFMDQPWEHDMWQSSPLKSIDGVPGQQEVLAPPKSSPNLSLELMKFGRNQYLCLIPPPPEEPTAPPPEDIEEVAPGHSWSLLQPLSGTCLYHRHGWFTYSYCHNSHVRQFRELMQPPNQRAGDWKPEEDPEWEAYTLGRAPPTLDPGADLTVAEEAALAANIELARGPGSRYLVQRWGDGTMCDKTGRKREVEIQFHCSMTTADSIVFIKETQTCHYVLHIATPRLCGEPGFKNRLDAREESFIRCREILSAEAYERADRTLPPADHPFKVPRRGKPAVIAPPPQKGTAGSGSDGGEKGVEGGEKGESAEDVLGLTGKGKGSGGVGQKSMAQLLAEKPDLLKKALEKLMSDTGDLQHSTAIVMDEGEDGEGFVVELLIDDLDLDAQDLFGSGTLFDQQEGKESEQAAETESDRSADSSDGKTKDGRGSNKAKASVKDVPTIPELVEALRVQQKTLLDLKDKLSSPQQKGAADKQQANGGVKGSTNANSKGNNGGRGNGGGKSNLKDNGKSKNGNKNGGHKAKKGPPKRP